MIPLKKSKDPSTDVKTNSMEGLLFLMPDIPSNRNLIYRQKKPEWAGPAPV